MAEPITLYVTTGSPYCAAKRSDLQQKRIKFKEINVTERPGVIPGLLRLAKGERLAPVIIEGERVSIAPQGGRDF
ncbi:MAG TPA: Uxx-star family glutaredoxin-like (seleno)protein [Candidatus Binataceae bacterium]|nr:Uxx-star family glutaredoxin-like (seleno)protein [Candidatus Binataceae bacterium]